MITPDQIKSLAASLGFDACGITRAEPIPEAEARLKDWIGEGRHGEMKYLENFEERARRFWREFPEAKSILVLGVNYYSGRGRGNGRKLTGRVARYAWGEDYHRVIAKRLELFKDKLSEVAGRTVQAEICVDTKPLLERSLAQKAGLGFIGKQSQLLSPRWGPWLFLAEVVTDLELEPDPPYVGSCGSCRICIDACPTQAIRPEGGIDARRCIAYLTIEHKSEIPESLRPLLGDWVFGCDLCLEVCPYSAKAKETTWTELKSESGRGESFDLVKLFQIPSNRAYEREFQGKAVLRASRKQLLRNAAVVLGNLKTKEALPILKDASEKEPELVAKHARWALAKIRRGEPKPMKKILASVFLLGWMMILSQPSGFSFAKRPEEEKRPVPAKSETRPKPSARDIQVTTGQIPVLNPEPQD